MSLISLRRRPGSSTPSRQCMVFSMAGPGRLKALQHWLVVPRSWDHSGRVVCTRLWKGQWILRVQEKCSRGKEKPEAYWGFCNGWGLHLTQPAVFNSPCNRQLLLSQRFKILFHQSQEWMDFNLLFLPSGGRTNKQVEKSGTCLTPDSLQNLPPIHTVRFFSLGTHHPLNNFWF